MQTAPIPSGLASSDDPELSGLACQSTGVCVAIGSDSSGPELDLSAAGDSGWQSVSFSAPSGLTSVTLTGVACPDSGDCVAIGTGLDASSNPQVVIVTGSGTTWTASEAPLRSGSSAVAIYPKGVACMASSCVVVSQESPASDLAGLDAITGSGSSWTATALPVYTPLPKGKGGTSLVYAGIACSPTGCEVAENYQYYFQSNPNAGTWIALHVSGPSDGAGGWVARKLVAPAAESTDNGGYAGQAVACASTKCLIAGYFFSTSTGAAFVAAGTGGGGGSWKTVVPPAPADANTTAPYIDGAACPSNSVCDVAVNYQTGGGSRGGDPGEFLASVGGLGSASRWTVTGDEDQAPYQLACASTTSCAADGTALFYGSGTSWTTYDYPLSGSAYSGEQAAGVTCWKPGRCLVPGYEYGINSKDEFITKPIIWRTQ